MEDRETPAAPPDAAAPSDAPEPNLETLPVPGPADGAAEPTPTEGPDTSRDPEGAVAEAPTEPEPPEASAPTEPTESEAAPPPTPAEDPDPSRDREGAVAEAPTESEPAEGAALPTPTEAQPAEAPGAEVSMDEFLPTEPEPETVSLEDAQLRAVIEAIVYVAEEPLTLVQLSAALQQPAERVRSILDQIVTEFDKPEHGVTVREVAGGFKMATKPEHHEAVRAFVKSLKPPLKLSLPALETLAVIAYKQPVTGPEIQEIRGVQGGGVLKTLLDRKLIAVAGRKNVIGKPMLYKTTKEFLIQFGLKDLAELPSLKEFEEIRRMAFTDEPAATPAEEPAAEAPLEAAQPEARQPEAAQPEAEQPAAPGQIEPEPQEA